MKSRVEEIKGLVITPGWKYLKEEFLKKKESLKELLMETNLDEKEGLDNARKFQAMFNAIDGFEELIQDIIVDLEEKIGG